MGFPAGPSSALRCTLLYLRDPYRLHETSRARFGDPVTIPTLAGRMVVTGRPDGVRELFSGDPEVFESAIPENMTDFVPQHSMQLLKGDRHRKERQLLSPFFLGPRLRSYRQIIEEVTTRRAAQVANQPRFNALELGLSLSLEVITRTVFGVEDAASIERYRRVTSEFGASIRPSILFLTGLRRSFAGLGPWSRYCRARKAFHELLAETISGRRRQAQPGSDILSLMLGARHPDGTSLSDAEVRDELITLMFAGHETTAIGLAWALYWIKSQRLVEERVLDELASTAHDSSERAGTPYLEAVCYEALRMNPMAVDITRRLSRDFEFLGRRLPAGTIICASPYLVHNDRNIYPDADRFIPERFLGKSPKPFEFLAFGGGAHRCIGAAFALYEMQVMLGALLRRYRLALLPDPRPVRAKRKHAALAPEGGIAMSVLSRIES